MVNAIEESALEWDAEVIACLFNKTKLYSSHACEEALETSTAAESEHEDLQARQRWADLVDTDDDCDVSFPLENQTRKPRWADMVESDDEEIRTPAWTRPQESRKLAAMPARRFPEAATRAARSQVPTPAAKGDGRGRSANENRKSDSKTVPKQVAGKAAGKGSRRSSKGSGKGSSDKLQCQFTIGIEEDAAFGVVRRILGRAGANMKSVAERTGVKLRLRGRGSNFLEGPEQKESSDDLMLCVSGQDKAGFELAKELVSQILSDIYEQHASFSRRMGRAPQALAIQVHDGYRAGSR